MIKVNNYTSRKCEMPDFTQNPFSAGIFDVRTGFTENCIMDPSPGYRKGPLKMLSGALPFVLPALITTLLFILAIYGLMIPTLRDSISEKKQDMARQMTLSAWSILENIHGKALSGEISDKEARSLAAELIGGIRYGPEMKDYFWISDSRPYMIYHPYRPDLIGRNIGEFEDPMGNKLFREMVRITSSRGAGFIEYWWQKHDNPDLITHKISYVKLFEPWDWIIGTGVYTEDIEADLRSISWSFTWISLFILLFIFLVLGFTAWRGSTLEKQTSSAETAKEESIRKFRAIFNQTFQLIGILDTEGHIINANKTALDLIGKTEEEVISREFWTEQWWSPSPEEAEKLKNAIRKAAEGEFVRYEAVNFDREGHRRFIDFSLKPVRDEKGKIIYLLPEGREISARKEAEEKLRLLNEDLERQIRERTGRLTESVRELNNTQEQLVQSEKMAALGRLVAGVAHEINTPLGIAVTAASFLEEKTEGIRSVFSQDRLTLEDFNGYLETSVESTGMILSNLQRAADQIKVFKKVAVDQSDEAIRPFTVKKYITEIITSLHPELKKKPCRLEVICPDDLTIISYPGAFSQILSNLILNSLFHGFRNRDSGTITINCRQEGELMILDYQDNGQGVDESVESKLFEPFFTTARARGGTGLGLHIVYNLVTQKLKGRIEARNLKQAGLGFAIEIPVSGETDPAGETH